jgi:multiple sugar transport system substrate-binding protein
VVFLPAPDFGAGGKIGGASWQWAISASCEYPEAASDYIESTLTPENIAAIADAQNVLPGRAEARPLTEKFDDGDPLSIFYEISAAQALIRPPTPAYTTIARIFERGTADIADGADVQSTLDSMVDEIEADIESNSGYGFPLDG